MTAIIALVLMVLTSLMGSNKNTAQVVVIPPQPNYAPTNMESECEAIEWALYNNEAYYDYVEEFTSLFNSYETKRAKNGALLIRRGNSGSYRFAMKG